MIVKTGQFVVAWKEGVKSGLVFGEIVRIMIKRKINYYPLSGFAQSKKNKYHLILKEMVLHEPTNILKHKLNKYVKITNDEIGLVFNSPSVLHSIKKIKEFEKKKNQGASEKNTKEEERKRELSEEELKVVDLKKFLKELGVKGVSGLKKSQLIQRLKEARGKNYSSYDGSQIAFKDTIYSGMFSFLESSDLVAAIGLSISFCNVKLN